MHSSVMGSRVFVAVVLVLFLGVAVTAEFDGYNGMPRPPGMDQAPTTTYGASPAVKYLNKPANCIWYGWENGNYQPQGTKNCSSSLWASLSKSNASDLAGFMYYVPLDTIFYDPQYNEYLCAIGCFDLQGSAASPGSAPMAAPPMGAISPVSAPPMGAIPPPVMAPPPVDVTPPPAMAPPSPAVMTPPPTATLFRPPPPATPLPPSQPPTGVVMPPTGSAPSKSPAKSPSDSSSGALAPGPSAGQTAAGTITSVSTLLVLSVTLLLSINLLV